MPPLESILDELLVLRAQLGDQLAARQLVERYQAPLRYFLIRLLGQRDGVDDVLQEVWLAVFRQIRKLQTREAFAVWIYRITRNRAYDFLRRARRSEPLPENAFSPADVDPEFTAEDAAAVHRCLNALSTEHREVLLLRFLEQMDYEQIADVTGCAVGTVKSRLHHAKLLLRQKMEQSHA
jgi:RNA polymerase sigma-70 factor (ECF subfamily)